MAKKKKVPSQVLSPERYIKEKARQLPLVECWIEKGWEQCGRATVIVARQHVNGNYTSGVYLLDTFCCGVTDSFFQFNSPKDIYEKLIDRRGYGIEMGQISYEEAHNLIYGAVAYAEEAGISPHSSFQLTQYILKEDTDEVPLIEYEFGKNGQHYLMANSRLQANTLLPLLEENLGDDFSYTIYGDTEEEDDDEDWDDEDWDEDYEDSDEDSFCRLQDSVEEVRAMMSADEIVPELPYSYIHPAYPAVLDVRNKQLVSWLYNRDSFLLSDEMIRDILALPRESLIHDLEQMALFEIGCSCDEISEENWEEGAPNILKHVSFFLGELQAEDSLGVILEILRQGENFFDYHFGDTYSGVFIPTLYLLGRNRLPELMEYMKEPGLYLFARCLVPSAVALVAFLHPERRAEVIEWFRQLLVLYTETLGDLVCCDGTLAGMVVNDLLDIGAVELLPEIEAMYETGLVDLFCCGALEEVKREFSFGVCKSLEQYQLDIYKRYQKYHKEWGD
ncbi:DUF1186 domain-containing protein [Bacteroides sp. UBA939]|uniref:DUF1186 domain-containing protein n=1 Tax=Bacteroides sp. UBA939 TaxID=1946092 RepID=UPI0025C20B66|nr:DUF1186 domain-containing protein [Bacteroides sp. UBA939]